MRKIINTITKIGLLFVLIFLSSTAALAQDNQNVYRLYNSSTSEHLYTTDASEKDTLVTNHGWVDEGIGWVAPTSGDGVVRLFNPSSSEHLYTLDPNEITTLTTQNGWVADNNGQPLIYSGGSIDVYRLFNPSNGRHHLTMDQNEYNTIPQQGWKQEGVALKAIGEGNPTPTTPHKTSYQPGLRTVKNFLQASMQPVGQTLYIWGGGWDTSDKGAGDGSMYIGLYPNWKPFFDQNGPGYDYNTTRYQINNGLDCAGFVGWTTYNTLNTVSRTEAEYPQYGEVYYADDTAEEYAKKGYGTFTPYGQVKNYLPGDVVSISTGHVYISLGQCADGSEVLVHASPPGVMITGTLGPNGEQTQATALSHQYMSRYFPEYYSRYSNKIDRAYDAYINKTSKMTWGDNFVGDPDGIRNLSAPEVLKVLFNEN